MTWYEILADQIVNAGNSLDSTMLSKTHFEIILSEHDEKVRRKTWREVYRRYTPTRAWSDAVTQDVSAKT